MSAEAFWSDEHRCWFVPVASELLDGPQDNQIVQPARVEFKDRQLWITQLNLGGVRDALLSLEFSRAVEAADLVDARRVVHQALNSFAGLRVGEGHNQ